MCSTSRGLTKDLGVFTFDPGFMATASTESKITYIDGDAGMLLYRGYPVEQLAERSSFLEVANLLIYGTSADQRGARRVPRIDHATYHGERAADAGVPRLPARCPPDGDGVGGGRLDGGVLSRHDGHQ